MKKELIVVISLALLWVGCREKGTMIDFGITSVNDTSYVLPASEVPAWEPHNVLVEEFTGQSCHNCPEGHEKLREISNQSGNVGRVNIVCHYASNAGPLVVPPLGSNFDFRNDHASEVKTTIFPDFPGLPSAGVDRTKYGGKLAMYSTVWGDAINIQNAVVDSVNLVVKSTYDSITNKATIKVQVVYLNKTEVVVPNNLHVMILEDSIISYQLVGSNVDDHYLFNHVLRHILTSVPSGDPLDDAGATKTIGRVYQRVFTYTPAPHNPSEPAPIPGNMRVVAFVANSLAGDNRVIQSKQAPLTGH